MTACVIFTTPPSPTHLARGGPDRVTGITGFGTSSDMVPRVPFHRGFGTPSPGVPYHRVRHLHHGNLVPPMIWYPVSQYTLSPVYFIQDSRSIYYSAGSISLVYFIPRQDILSLHGDQGMSQNISVATQSSRPAVSQCSLNSTYGMCSHRGEI